MVLFLQSQAPPHRKILQDVQFLKLSLFVMDCFVSNVLMQDSQQHHEDRAGIFDFDKQLLK